MWNLFCIIIFIADLGLLSWFIVGKFRKTKLSDTILFIGCVFTANFTLHILSAFYNDMIVKSGGNIVIEIISGIGATVKMFVGEVDAGFLSEIANAYPSFTYVYVLGTCLALISTINTVAEALEHTVRNNLKLSKAMRRKVCDIVVGSSSTALKYAKASDAVILLDSGTSKETVTDLIEGGFSVLHRSFSAKLLNSKLFKSNIRYNFICPKEENTLEYINTVTSFIKADPAKLDIHLFVEIEGDKAETVRREIIGSNNMESYIDTFCINELLARTFTEENPVSKYLPKELLKNCSLDPNTDISVFIIGYGKLGHELFKQSILNNQYVAYTDRYEVLPLKYYLCDKGIDPSEWLINGMKETIEGLYSEADQYFPIPELTHSVSLINTSPQSREILNAVIHRVKKPESYAFIIIDTEDDYSNIEIASKLQAMLHGKNNYHISVRCEDASVENSSSITYFGKKESVLNHDVIVNDVFSAVGMKLNEMYEANYADSAERSRSDFPEYIRNKAKKSWSKLDCFTKYSNIYSAMNLRVKLNLMGLDYSTSSQDTSENDMLPNYKASQPYTDNFICTPRNALIAQEHARWNAYHLVNEWLPLERDLITVKQNNDGTVRFNTKIPEAKKHACITTHLGLNDLSVYLSSRAGNGTSAANYDYYCNDEFLFSCIDEIFGAFNYSAVKRLQ